MQVGWSVVIDRFPEIETLYARASSGSQTELASGDSLEQRAVESNESVAFAVIHEQWIPGRTRVEANPNEILSLRLEGSRRLDLAKDAYEYRARVLRQSSR
jgi:hypothetical protein